MRCTLLILLFCISLAGRAQVTETPPTTEQQLENVTENNEDLETEDDSYLQQLAQFQRNPVNLNTADPALLKELLLLSPIQVQSLIDYRNLLGPLVNIYELQALPGWDVPMIQRLRPFVTVSMQPSLGEVFGERLRNGDHQMLARVTQVLERSRGYLIDSSVSKNFYPGSPQKLFLRYKYIYKNLLQYGVVAEKDAGEQFFKGGQSQGFDHYSAHLFIRNIGIVRSLALGDFTVNLGQGLTQWMSLAFKKGPDVLATKRQASVLRPYNSAGEIFFHRGAGITIGKRNWEATVFGSYRNIDGNLNAADSLQSEEDFISSFQTSGFHRTASEVEDKGVQRQLAFGGNVRVQLQRLQLGLNGIQYQFKYPLQKQKEPYNKYALEGKTFGNYSADYSYTYKNVHLFGELATTDKQYLAFVNGMLVSVASNVDMSLFYRNISPGYQSLYTNAFTEGTYPTNEKGLFAGVSIRPHMAWRIDAYADMYRFPWARFRVDAPSTGSDYLVQVTYRPNKQWEMYSRFKKESKSINYNPADLVLNPVIAQPRQNWRTQFSYRINPAVTLRSRTEIVWFDKKGEAAEQGFLIYGDFIYKPVMKRYSGNIRLQYFETDSYNSRLYAYEADVLYSFSIPVFYDKGYRYYVNFNYDINKKLSMWARIAQTVYPEKESVGSGLDEISKNHRTEVKLQALYRF